MNGKLSLSQDTMTHRLGLGCIKSRERGGREDGSSEGREDGSSEGREGGSGSLPLADFDFMDFDSFNFASFESNLLDFVPVVSERFSISVSTNRLNDPPIPKSANYLLEIINKEDAASSCLRIQLSSFPISGQFLVTLAKPTRTKKEVMAMGKTLIIVCVWTGES